MSDDLRTKIAAVLYQRFATAMGFADASWENIEHQTWLEDADAVIAELDRDYIIVEPGTPLAQRIAQWQL